jgi:hypothetical protein
MESTAAGELVSVATGNGHSVDGIVFDTPSAKKVVVAVVDPTRGPALRTVHPDALSARETEGAGDRAMRMLIKRTPPPVHRNGAAGGTSAGRGSAGHSRGASHRTSDH